MRWFAGRLTRAYLRIWAFQRLVESLGGRSDGDHCRVSVETWARLGRYASRFMTFQDFVCIQLKEGLTTDSFLGPALDNGMRCMPTLAEALSSVRSRGSQEHAARLNANPHWGWLGPTGILHTARFRSRMEEGSLVIEKRISFVPRSSRAYDAAVAAVQQAEMLYNESAEENALPIRYRFVVTDERADSEIELIAPGIRSTAERWSESRLLNGTSHTLEPLAARFAAHEIGHLLGLRDEYDENPGTTGHHTAGCLSDAQGMTSVMCVTRSGRATVQAYHHYLLLRLMACPSRPYQFMGWY